MLVFPGNVNKNLFVDTEHRSKIYGNLLRQIQVIRVIDLKQNLKYLILKGHIRRLSQVELRFFQMSNKPLCNKLIKIRTCVP